MKRTIGLSVPNDTLNILFTNPETSEFQGELEIDTDNNGAVRFIFTFDKIEGELVVSFNGESLAVATNMPDDNRGRSGVIYELTKSYFKY